jgi:Flp pilus assembly protein TadG
MTAMIASRCGRCLSRLLRREKSGIAALEFGLVAPIFAMMLAGATDLGNYLLIDMRLVASVSAGANYALINNSNVEATDGPTLAAEVAQVIANNVAANWANVTVVINNGPTVTITRGATTSSGTATNAGLNYCPTGSSGKWSWGGAVSSGSNCAGGGTAGKFVAITATTGFTPIFPVYKFVGAGNISATAMVQVK